MRAGGITPSGAWPSFSFPAWPSQQAQRTPLLPSPCRLRAVVSDPPRAAFVAEASQRFGIPEHWIVAVKRAESAGDVRAISSAGAMGLMQIMPDTWAALRVRYGLGRDPYDPRDNILAGAAYLREMFDRYRTIPAMLGAYNAGPGRYDEYVQTGRALPAETRAYIAAGSAAGRVIAVERAIGCAATAAGLAGSAALRHAFRRRSFGNIAIGKRAVER
jgi:soluble lytic murein transglycosylase-like protein